MKNFDCSQCKLTFTYPSLLERHNRIHSKQKSYKCPYCPKSFVRADTLKTHVNIHSNRGYMCCGKTLHSRASLKYHIKSFHDLKCPKCNQSFQTSKLLFIHISSHTQQEITNKVEIKIQPFVKAQILVKQEQSTQRQQQQANL